VVSGGVNCLRAADLRARINVVVDEAMNAVCRARRLCHHSSEIRDNSQRGKHLKRVREVTGQLNNIRQQMLERRVGVVKPVSKQYADDDVGDTASGQLSDVKTLTVLLAHFADHVVNLGHDARLHHSLTETEMFQDGQTLHLASDEPGVVMTEYDS